MSRNFANALALALVLGVCSIGCMNAADKGAAPTPETAKVVTEPTQVVAEKTVLPTEEIVNINDQIACRDLSDDSDFDFNLDDDDVDDDI